MTAIPFRADHVGSLLRPPRLHDARAAAATGRIDADELTQIEDDCIREVVRQQEALGLDVVTDGEFRRSWWTNRGWEPMIPESDAWSILVEPDLVAEYRKFRDIAYKWYDEANAKA